MSESAIQDYRVATEPYYLPVGREVELFEAAHSARLPVILKGPTGCGKTRFVEHMAWRLERPLITVACHEDLSSTDLVGRFLLEFLDRARDFLVRGRVLFLEERRKLRKGQRLARGEQGGFEDAFELGEFCHVPLHHSPAVASDLR